MPLLFVLCALLVCGCNRQPQLSPLPRGGVILAFGDSLTFGTGVKPEYSYPAVLASLSGRQVVQSGVPGEISSLGLQRLRKVLPEVNPGLVILCHGGNDVLRRMSAATTESNLRQMIKLARQQGAQVAVIAVPTAGLFPQAQAYYTTIEQDLDVPVEFDIVADLETNRSMKSDQIHFNRDGYRQMAEAVYTLLTSSGAL